MGQHILVIGSGGREHAIAHALVQSPTVDAVTVAPGNTGMQGDGIQLAAIDPANTADVIRYIHDHHIDWVFVGPETPLIAGIVDDLQAADIPVFGPTAAAAQIEGSKTFAKELMDRHHIPTAGYRTFDTFDDAAKYVRQHGAPIVVKADGLAAGKGVTVAMDEDTAMSALEAIFVDHRFGDAGARVVLEDYLEGQEFSLMSFVSGRQFWPMPIAQDHKRAYDGDAGPNTGGMGAYSPVPQIADATVQRAIDEIVRPVVEAMADEGTPFTGILYAGLIDTVDGPKVIEFNARFGDPETQVVLPRLDSDLAAAISAILQGQEPQFAWKQDGATVGVVLAAEGYPDNVHKGALVPTLHTDDASHVYYAGVQPNEQGLTASSGRVLLVAATADSIQQAQQQVYELLDNAPTTGMFYRHDIANKALQ